MYYLIGIVICTIIGLVVAAASGGNEQKMVNSPGSIQVGRDYNYEKEEK